MTWYSCRRPVRREQTSALSYGSNVYADMCASGYDGLYRLLSFPCISSVLLQPRACTRGAVRCARPVEDGLCLPIWDGC